MNEEPNCLDCGGQIPEGATRCDLCDRSARWNRRITSDPGDAQHGELFTGTELLGRIWPDWRR